MGFVVCSLVVIVRPIIISVFVLLVSRCPDSFLLTSIFVYFIYFGEQKVPGKHCRCAVCAKKNPKKYIIRIYLICEMRAILVFEQQKRKKREPEQQKRLQQKNKRIHTSCSYSMRAFVFRFFAPASFAARLACEICIIFISRVFISNAKRTLTLGRYPHDARRTRCSCVPCGSSTASERLSFFGKTNEIKTKQNRIEPENGMEPKTYEDNKTKTKNNK